MLHLLDWFIGSCGFSSLERRPEFWVLHCEEILCHIPYISNISLQHELSDVERDLNSGKRLCQSLHIYKVFPRYGFADVELKLNSI